MSNAPILFTKEQNAMLEELRLLKQQVQKAVLENDRLRIELEAAHEILRQLQALNRNATAVLNSFNESEDKKEKRNDEKNGEKPQP